VSDRPIWTTQKVRAVDLTPGDVTRDGYNKWNRVAGVKPANDGYVTVTFQLGGSPLTTRAVHLMDVQVAKPS
jgi:hypothetical protein